MPPETLIVVPTGVGDEAVVNVTVTTGFVVDVEANMIMKVGNIARPVNDAAAALHEMVNESPVFKLIDVFDDTAVPL